MGARARAWGQHTSCQIQLWANLVQVGSGASDLGSPVMGAGTCDGVCPHQPNRGKPLGGTHRCERLATLW